MDHEMLHNRGSSSRDFRTTAVILLVGNVLLLLGFQVLRGGSGYDSLFGWIGNLSMLIPTLACVAYAVLGGPLRAAAIWLALAMLSQSAGNVIFSTWAQFLTDPPVPSPQVLAL